MSFLLSLISSLPQNQRTRGQNSFYPEAGDKMWEVVKKGEVAQTMYTHVSKCKKMKE
jgi:hypothetical protein